MGSCSYEVNWERILVEVGGNKFHTLSLHTTLVQFAGVDQLAAVDDHELVRRVDMNEGIVVVFQAHRISSLILQMYVSASFRISANDFKDVFVIKKNF